MAADLITAYRLAGREWFHVRQSLGHDGGDFAKLQHWGLIEEAPAVREDGGRAGWWRITAAGAEFATGRASVPKYVLIFNAARYGYTGDAVTVRDCLRDRFDLRELLEGAPPDA